VKVGRGRHHADYFDRPGPRAEALQRRHERVQRVREDVQQLRAQGALRRSVGLKPRRPKREVAVDERDRPQCRGLTHQPAKGRVADELMPRTHEQPALAREREQRLRLFPRLDERLLDVHMRPGKERLPGRLEMATRGRTDVGEVRPRGLEQAGHRGPGLSSGAPGEGLRHGRAHVVDPDDEVRRRDAGQRLEMVAGHVAGPDGRDSQGSRTRHHR